MSGPAVPITTRRIVMHKNIPMNKSSLTLTAFAVSEYRIISTLPRSSIAPNTTTEKLLTAAGIFQHAQSLELSLHRKLVRDEISQALARINLLNEFFADVGQRLEFGTETLIPVFGGLDVGFRRVDLKTISTVFIFEQDGSRCEMVSASVAEMTFLRDGLGQILNL